nr:uncharacterized protein LOC120962851 [Aegilops tauschii subsp. strangulata]XP_045083601.1 uncharacterized protein LOC120962851 [Aegilops tauschii subsp. strangulata]XP_045083602.1 uncharacterized protein LOC120962851 [Aegilops tauschii subsp. strangulata]XP_045083603.1 uncharacterized protein LOC120962851 [Aegilops tauschii subsp. strangulata]XP_045083604.1 uncharacterized protein LOC120962851 [Aegilops tauschii subsp. strangulata]XP_045083605.1 uncharacterized protein LOC120962851 [Aegilop
MVSDISDPASAPMEHDDGDAPPAVPLAAAPPAVPPAPAPPAPAVPAAPASPAPALAVATAPALPASAMVAVAPPPPSIPSSVLQTVDIRRHVPVTLDLLAGNYTEWRRHFDTVIGMFGLRDHVDPEALPRLDHPEWLMADHVVVHWLYTTIAPELLDAVMHPEDTAIAVWTAIDGVFRDNHLARAVYVDAEYHAAVQGDMSVMQYCTKLKNFTDQLRDLGQPVTDTRQVFHLLRGLNRQYHSVIPHVTSQVPLPSFLQVRSFLLLEEHRAEQSARLQSTHALVAGRGSPSTPPTPAPSNTNQQGRGRGRRRGCGNGGQGAHIAPSPSPLPRPPAVPAPAPGANSWTGLVQAWPMAWRAPGAGVLGPRPATPPQQAMYAAPAPTALPLPVYGSPGAYPPGYAPPPHYNTPGAGPSSSPSPAWDMASLQAALHSATAGPSSSGTSQEWYLDSGAAAHTSPVRRSSRPHRHHRRARSPAPSVGYFGLTRSTTTPLLPPQRRSRRCPARFVWRCVIPTGSPPCGLSTTHLFATEHGRWCLGLLVPTSSPASGSSSTR